MNMKNLLALVFLCTVGLVAAQDEDFSGKSLEELKVIYAASMKNIAGTPERKKMKKIGQKRDEVLAHLTEASWRCSLYRYNGWTTVIPAWIEGVAQNDCDVVAQYEKELRKVNSLLLYADQQAIIANPELKTIVDCMVKKEYEAVEISDETV